MTDLGVVDDRRSAIHLDRSANRGRSDDRRTADARRLRPLPVRAADQSSRPAALPGLGGALAAALDQSDDAVVLLDDDGCVVHANRAAERLADAGCAIALRAGRLVIDNEALATLAAAASDSMAGGRRTGGGASVPVTATALLDVTVTPLPADAGPATVMLIARRKPVPATVNRDARLRAFGLTPAETRVALAVADGATPRLIAARGGTSVQTVRNQLRRVFEKTGASRQVDLVRLLLPALAAPAAEASSS